MRVLLDTHAVVLLWEGQAKAFGVESRRLLETLYHRISPLIRLELGYLHEIGRLAATPEEIIYGLAEDTGLSVVEEDVGDLVREAERLSWTRDPFDRLLVASAKLHEAPFITRDRTILEHFEAAVW